MAIIAFDTETCQFRAGVMAPELVCVTWQREGEDAQIMDHTDARLRSLVEGWLDGGDILVGHNVAYDMGVLCAAWPDLIPKVFDKYDRDQVTCTKIRQQLIDIAAGEYRFKPLPDGTCLKYDYSLDTTFWRMTGNRLKKDGWRLMYGLFQGRPLDSWLERAAEIQAHFRANPVHPDFDPKDIQAVVDGPASDCISYPLMDAFTTLSVCKWQERDSGILENQWEQARAAFALNLMSAKGLRTSPEGVEELKKKTEILKAGIESSLNVAGLVRDNGSRDTKKAKEVMQAMYARTGKTPRLTKTGDLSLDADACDLSDDDLLKSYALLTRLNTITNKDIVALERGVYMPIHTSYGLAASGRTTSSNPNVQNWSK